MIKFFLPFLAFLFVTLDLSAQGRNAISGDPVKLADELTQYLSSNRDPKVQQTIREFNTLWAKEEGLSHGQKGLMTKTVAEMFNKRQNSPQVIEQYLRTVISYNQVVQSKDTVKFYDWHDVLERLLQDSRRDFNGFNTALNGLFLENALYLSGSKNWYSSSGEYYIRMEEEPFIVFDNLDLSCVTRQDTITIFNTKGRYFPTRTHFEGKGGEVQWTRFGLDNTMVNAKLNNYSVNTSLASYEADSVQFVNAHIFGFPLMGKLEDRAYMDNRGDRGSYPRFTAYQEWFEINNLIEGVRYEGGFRMQGGNLQGLGLNEGKARIFFSYNGAQVCKIESNMFSLDPGRISSNKASFTLYLEDDSIYHPQLVMQYITNNKELTVNRKDEGLYMAPFFSSYHKLEMSYDGISWRTDQPLLHMRLLNNPEGEAIFESVNYYRDTRYARIQSILDYNPVDVIYRFSTHIRSREFTIQELASYMNTNINNIERLIVLLNNEGYLFYDSGEGKIILKDKVHLYYNASRNRQDYDVIRFRSMISARSNASLSLENFDLRLEGVPMAMLSDSQGTYIVPHDQKVTIKKHMDMQFDGHVRSGRFDFFGKNFFFDYRQFKIELNDVDSVKFMFPERDHNNVVRMRQIQTVLQDVGGYLYIDHPFNKSGRKNHSEYPIFECSKSAYVYYDRKDIFDGVYDRERFYFHIRPFTIDSLDNFTIAGLSFAGTFHSAGIFPDFDDELRIQEDYSLGLSTHTPHGGYPLYGGKGTGNMTISLSNKGLRSSGKIDHLAANIESNDIILFPDSMHATAQTWKIPDPGRDIYPKVDGYNVFTNWKPYSDSMFVYQKDRHFNLYTENIEYHGHLVLTPQRLTGGGELFYKRGVMGSKLFAFYRQDLQADTGYFNIQTENPEILAFKTPNIKLKLDFPSQQLTATSNLNTPSTQFPLNQYRSSLKNINWDIAQQEVKLKAEAEQTGNSPIFHSSNPEQDSLWFKSEEAVFNVPALLIQAEKVPLINVADSRVFPDSQIVRVARAAEMLPLVNAEIKTDTINNYHRLYNAYVNVFGRKRFAAYGYYDYVDKDEKNHPIKMNEIRVNMQGKTTAKGHVSDTSDFYLSRNFDYKGDVSLLSTRQAMEFNGFVKPIHQIAGRNTGWFRHNSVIKPDSLYFVIDTVRNDDRLELFTGVFLASDSAHVYNCFMGRKRNYSDIEVFRARGTLYYDDAREAFVITNTENFRQGILEGGFYEFRDKTGYVRAEGKIDLGAKLEHIETHSAGEVTFNPNDSLFLFDVVMTMNFEFDNNVMKLLTDSLSEFGSTLADNRNNRHVVKLGVSEIMQDHRDKRRVIAALEENLLLAEREMRQSFVFSDLQFMWDPVTSTFKTVGGVGLANVGQVQVNKKMPDAEMQFIRRRSGDRVNIYFESREGQWYYFNYFNGTLSVVASDEIFNTKLLESFRKYSKGKYRIRKGTRRQRDIFLRDLNPVPVVDGG